MRPLQPAVALLLALLLAACAGAPVAPQPTTKPDSNGVTDAQDPPVPTPVPPPPGGTLVGALPGEPAGLDPAGPAGAAESVLLPYLFDTLVAHDFENNIVPNLADQWQVGDDGTSVSFTLKDGLSFHDGSPLDAQAVVSSFERLRGPQSRSPLAESLQAVTSIEAVDAKTVRFRFAQPAATFFSTVASPYAGIISVAGQAAGEGAARQPVGSGPFRLKSWEPGAAITLERNEAYRWGPPMVRNRQAPYLQTLVFQIIPDDEARLAALRAGAIDLLSVSRPDQIGTLRGEASIAFEPINRNGQVYLGFNTARAPFDDLRARRAVSYALDKAALVATALGGEGDPAFAPMPTTLLGYDTQLLELEIAYDPAQTEALLTEAGFAKGADGAWSRGGLPLGLSLLAPAGAPEEEVAAAIEAQLEAVGIAVEVKQLDPAAADEAARAGDYDLLLGRLDGSDPDLLRRSLGSAGSANRIFYSNPEVDRLLDAAAQELDIQSREQLYLDAQRLIMADVPWQPLYTPVEMLAFSARLVGVKVGSMGHALLNDVTVQE
jgi:peptide/nickel transport system substrate-binding protein